MVEDESYDDALAALEAENRSLREYLKRVLTMLETRADEGPANRPTPAGPREISMTGTSSSDRDPRRAT